jgi:hypothetical protein
MIMKQLIEETNEKFNSWNKPCKNDAELSWVTEFGRSGWNLAPVARKVIQYYQDIKEPTPTQANAI